MPAAPAARAVTKTEFLAYLTCPEEAWMQRHEPLPTPPSPLQRLAREDGERVDARAREYLAKPGVAQRLFGEPGRVTFRERFTVPGRWLCQTDVVFYPTSGGSATLVEVKASTVSRRAGGVPKPKPAHLLDLAYQRFVLTAAGQPVGSCGLLLLSGEYCLGEGGLDLACLFTYVDVTAELYTTPRGARETYAERVIREALEAPEALNGPPPAPWAYRTCGNGGACRWMQRAIEVPQPSVFDVPRLSGAKLQALLDEQVLAVRDVPDYAALTTKQRRCVDVLQRRIAHCDQADVGRRLAGLRYPLYFLDYETVSSAIPSSPGMRPYQRFAFQYSLHIRRAPGGDLEHRECCLEDRAAGCEPLLDQLTGDLQRDGGSVVVWNRGFEASVNRELAVTYPAYAGFLADVNARLFDLMEVYRDECVEDHRFGGSHSIKRVLPVLVPEFAESYDALEIGEGESASYVWHRLSEGAFSQGDAAAALADLRAYCRLDTLAMVQLLDWASRDTSDTHPHVRF